MVLATRHAQAQGTAPSIRQDVDLGAEAASAAAPRGIRFFLRGRARRAHGRALILEPLVSRIAALLPRAPVRAAIVLSSRTADRSGWACRWANRRGQMPWLHPAA